MTGRLIASGIVFVAVLTLGAIALAGTGVAPDGKPMSPLCCPDGAVPLCWCGGPEMVPPCPTPWAEVSIEGTDIVACEVAP